MRLSYFLVLALATLLACSETVAAKKHPRHRHDQTIHNKNKRFLRLNSKEATINDTPGAEDDEEERKFVPIVVDQPQYHRWFKAHMTPQDVEKALGLTGGSLTPLAKALIRQDYKGYVVYYEKHCRKPRYRRMAFCLRGAK